MPSQCLPSTRILYMERDQGSRGIPVADGARHPHADGPAAPGRRWREQPVDADVRPALGRSRGRRTPV